MKNRLVFDLEFIYVSCFAIGVGFFLIGLGGILSPSIESLIMNGKLTILPYAIGSLQLGGIFFIITLTVYGICNIVEFYEKYKKPKKVNYNNNQK